PEGEMVRGAVQVGTQALPFGPTLVGTSTEWAFDEARTEELKQVSLASGGRELLELSQAWRSPRTERFVDLRNEILLLALILMLAEALITRTGWHLPEWAFAGWKLKGNRPSPSPAVLAHQKRVHKDSALPPATAPTPPEAPPPPEPEINRQSRFDRAKKR
ncbi:MAG: hypothetical protein V4599_11190, partial [Verrucomicrobiota bacterium]